MLDRKDLKEHYTREEVKKEILKRATFQDYWRMGKAGHKGVYHLEEDRPYQLDKDYDEIVERIIDNGDRSLYWTLNFNTQKSREKKKKDNDTGSKMPIDYGDSRAFSFAADIDIKDEETNVNDAETREALEKAAQFIADRFKDITEENVYAYFSGNGVYVLMHEGVFNKHLDINKQLSDIEDEEVLEEALTKLSERDLEEFCQKFNIWLRDIEDEMHEEIPETEVIGVDAINMKNRVFKSLFSIHSSLDYACIPLDTDDIKIDLDKASLPLTDEVIEEARDWYPRQPSNVGKARVEFVDLMRNIYMDSESQNYLDSEEAKELSGMIEEEMKGTDHDQAKFPDIIRRIMKKGQKFGKSGARSSAILSGFLSGIKHPKGKEIWKKTCKKRGMPTSNIWESWTMPPNYQTLKEKETGFPHMGMKGSGLLKGLTVPKSGNPVSHYLDEIGVDVKKFLIEIKIKEIDEDNWDAKLDEIGEIIQQEKRKIIWTANKLRKEKPEILPSKKELKEWLKEAGETEESIEEESLEEEDEEEDEPQTPPDLEDLYGPRTINQARDLLEEEHILKKVKTVLDYKIAGEDRTKLGLFLQLLTKDFEEPLMIYGIQKQGEGKSFIAKNVVELFPDRQVIDVTDMTKAALYRLVQKEGKDFFDGKIVYFGEVPEQEDDRTIFQIFRQLVSEGRVSKMLVLENSGEMETTQLELEGAPAMISTTIDEGRISEEDMSRGVTYSPSMSERQYEFVREYQNKKESLPEEAIMPEEIKELEEVVKCALDIISREEVEVKNPWVGNIDEIIPKYTSNIKRDYNKVLKITGRVPTYLYHRQRPEAGGYYLTTWKDIVRGLWINKSFINGMLEGRVQATLDAFEKIKEKVSPVNMSFKDMKNALNNDEDIPGESFSSKDLEGWLNVADQTARSYTRKLYKMGLIFKDDSVRPHRHYLPEQSETKNGGITLRALYIIIEGFIRSEKLSEWANMYYSKLDSKREGGVVREGQLGLNEEKLPIQIDLGLHGSYEKFDTPIYMKNEYRSFKLPKSLKIEKNGSIIMCDLRSVNKSITQISTEDIEENQEEEEEDKDNGADGEEKETKKEQVLNFLQENPEASLGDISAKDGGVDGVKFEEVGEIVEDLRKSDKVTRSGGGYSAI